MSAANIDFAGLLAELESREGYSVPYEVKPVRGAASPTLQAALNAAIDSANTAAIERVPLDPSWSTPADHGDSTYVAELSKGTMEAAEVRAWFADLGRFLETVDGALRVRAVRNANHPPNLDDWRHLPGPPTAFLHFSTTDGPHRSRVLPDSVIEETAGDLVRWSRMPASALVLERGLTDWLCPFERGAEQLKQVRPADEPQFGLWSYCTAPRRMRLARFSFDAKAVIQVLDPALSPLDQLAAVLDGVAILAPYLNYAYVRPATAVTPSEYDLGFVERRNLPAVEQSVAAGQSVHLLDRYVINAYVAQVLTTSHLEPLTDLHLFDVRGIDSDHHMVLAKDPAPWLPPRQTGPVDLKGVEYWHRPPALTKPPEAVLAAARAELADILLTPEVVKANPPTWMTP